MQFHEKSTIIHHQQVPKRYFFLHLFRFSCKHFVAANYGPMQSDRRNPYSNEQRIRMTTHETIITKVVFYTYEMAFMFEMETTAKPISQYKYRFGFLLWRASIVNTHRRNQLLNTFAVCQVFLVTLCSKKLQCKRSCLTEALQCAAH